MLLSDERSWDRNRTRVYWSAVVSSSLSVKLLESKPESYLELQEVLIILKVLMKSGSRDITVVVLEDLLVSV